MTPRSLALAALTLGSLLSSGLLAQPTSHQQNPTVVFPGPGTYDVTLTVCNAAGCSQKTKSITVLDPVPRLTSALAQPTPVPIGQIVTLSAKATGKPPIAFHWTITSPAGGVTLLAGNPASWPTAHLAPGAYSVDLRADSPSGSATAHAGTVVLVPDAPASFWRLSRPCRLLDTRSTTPLLSTDPPRVFSVTSNAACPIPAKAVAIAANVTAVNPTAPGYFVLFPGNYCRAPDIDRLARSQAPDADELRRPPRLDGRAGDPRRKLWQPRSRERSPGPRRLRLLCADERSGACGHPLRLASLPGLLHLPGRHSPSTSLPDRRLTHRLPL